MVFGTRAQSTAVVKLPCFSGCTNVRAAFLLNEQGEMRGGPESSQQTVPPELSRPGEHDVYNNSLVPSSRAYAY